MTCQRQVCLAWHRRHCDGQQSATISHQAPSPIHQKPDQRLKGTPWIPLFSSVLPHFQPRRCPKRHLNPPSEGVNTFYGQTNCSNYDYLDTSSRALIMSCRKNQTFHGRFSYYTQTFPLQYAQLAREGTSTAFFNTRSIDLSSKARN